MSALDIFAKLCAIPHRSYHTQEMFDFLCKYAANLGYEVQTDKAKNIYITPALESSNLDSNTSPALEPSQSRADFKNLDSGVLDSSNLDSNVAQKSLKKLERRPKICLQAHYDMVGVGAAERAEALSLYMEGQFLRARESSLGADNGAAILWLLALEEYRGAIEVLFTNDEEVGLCGANELEIPIRAPFLLNLDSEFFGEIIVGCAGGFDVEFDVGAESLVDSGTDFLAESSADFVADSSGRVDSSADSDAEFGGRADSSVDSEAGTFGAVWAFEIEAFGFVGGHSGVDIHKNIPSSIVEFARLLEILGGYGRFGIARLNAGEKANSIPVGLSARVVVKSKKNPRKKAESSDLDSMDFGVDLCDLARYLQSQASAQNLKISLESSDNQNAPKNIKISKNDIKQNKKSDSAKNALVDSSDAESKEVESSAQKSQKCAVSAGQAKQAQHKNETKNRAGQIERLKVFMGQDFGFIITALDFGNLADFADLAGLVDSVDSAVLAGMADSAEFKDLDNLAESKAESTPSQRAQKMQKKSNSNQNAQNAQESALSQSAPSARDIVESIPSQSAHKIQNKAESAPKQNKNQNDISQKSQANTPRQKYQNYQISAQEKEIHTCQKRQNAPCQSEPRDTLNAPHTSQNQNIPRLYDTQKLAKIITSLKHGVSCVDSTHANIVLSSLNIAMIATQKHALTFTLKARANTQELLESMRAHIISTLERRAIKNAKISNHYAPWQRQLDEKSFFMQVINDAFKWRYAEIGEVHAGLECGILQGRFAKMGLEPVLMASIGPTILYPHSTKERMDVGSFEEFLKVLEDIIKRLKYAKI
ncbi:hypothetical protein BKN38_08050 [Helicobacter sp. CLO-3]|uniref:hypothetical protein n=1 Tax=unclassified Helicobacter TaxID=2593540 RepID=UPI000804FAB5|nr:MULTISPECIES: hypothetical protein [unclassified Helicobacter]OBV29548.1 hypothetical protein BA723_05230 [Helicobacter sp. CLO-3]OHU81904.1 hypothetical protein BKN38_08050 [Helicobacter sp. CLO-3]